VQAVHLARPPLSSSLAVIPRGHRATPTAQLLPSTGRVIFPSGPSRAFLHPLPR
jgi:hypothetical protein